ncbi:MAG: PE/PPE C-terminal domain-containing protein, partial [Mycobacterium sp.]
YVPSSLAPSMIGYLTATGNAVGGGAAGTGIGALLMPGGPLSALGGLGGGVSGAAGAASAAAGSVSTTTPAVSAAMGQARLVNSFSAPQSWAAATPATAGTAALPASGWAVAPETNSVAAMPGGIPGAGAGRGGFGFGTPRYGSKPTVMPRPVMVG